MKYLEKIGFSKDDIAYMMENTPEKFIELLRSTNREGIEDLIAFLDKTDFFTAPASTRFHGSFERGLLEHSLKVYEILDYKVKHCVIDMNVSEDTIKLVALLHDICKLNYYKVDYRNAKNEQGIWEKVPYYRIDDKLPYGHGEKSVYIISSYMKLSREESFAIRYHMGFSGIEDKNTIGRAFEMFPLAFAVSVADMEASYFLEGSEN